MNDSATGANVSPFLHLFPFFLLISPSSQLDSMQDYYGVTYDKISLVFLAQTAGYFVSCNGASAVLQRYGIQVALAVACTGMVAGCATLAAAPPFGAFVMALGLLGFGSGMVRLSFPAFSDVELTNVHAVRRLHHNHRLAR
jgi:fucose permease